MSRNVNTAEPAATTALDVHIVTHDGQVNKNSVKVSVGAHHEIRWWAKGNDGAKIVFTGKNLPFQERVFFVPANGTVSTGEAICAPDPNVHYKYTVVGPAGETDPEVIIDH